jgi:flagellar M-ring protein FliF
MTQRVVSLLEPVVGEDRVRANVSVRLNAESQEETEERWDPTTVMRSRQTSSENAGGLPTMFAGGVAGARSNLPTPPVSAPPPAGTPPSAGAPSSPATAAPLSAAATVAARPAPGVAGAAAARSAETTNFEVGKTVRHTVRPRGDIARISVAVLIDNEQIAKPGQPGTTTRRARTPADLQKIQGIVAAAVGLDPSRGDQLTVENIPFDNGAELPVPIAGTWERYGPQLMDAARIAAVVLLGLAGLLVVIRPAIRRTLAALPAVVPVPQLPAHLPRTVDDLQGELAAQLEEAESNSVESRKLLSKRVSTLAQKEPENAARLIRSWLSEEEAQ